MENLQSICARYTDKTCIFCKETEDLTDRLKICILQSIDDMKKLNKSNQSSAQLSSTIMVNRQQLVSFILDKYNINLKHGKANYYSLSNKSGAMLAKKVKSQHTVKQKTLHILHPTTACKLVNP